MHTKGLVCFGWRRVHLNGIAERADHLLIPDMHLRRGAFQRFPDNLRRIEGHTEKRLSDPRHIARLRFRRATAGHGGRRADADDLAASEGQATPPDQQRHVGTLPPTVRMQFVED